MKQNVQRGGGGGGVTLSKDIVCIDQIQLGLLELEIRCGGRRTPQ